MRIQFACLLLVLLSATELSEALGFYERHLKSKMSPDQCNGAMKVINRQEKEKCSDFNTFIVADNLSVKELCVGVPDKKTPSNSKEFPTFDCTYGSGELPNCVYKGEPHKSLIKVLCDNGYPFHLHSVARGPP